MVYEVEFAPCETRRCVNVNFTDDLVNEPDETYFLTLTKVSPFITLISPKGNFVKIDDDGKLTYVIVNLEKFCLMGGDMRLSFLPICIL